MGKTYDDPVDAFGTTLRKGSIVAYAVTEGRSAVMRYGILADDPKKNKGGAMKLRVTVLYSPSSGHRKITLDNDSVTSVECGPRIHALGITYDAFVEKLKLMDAKERLGEAT